MENPRQEDGTRQLQYRVTLGDRTVVLPSALGLEMDGIVYGRDVRRPSVRKTALDEPYTLKSGNSCRPGTTAPSMSFLSGGRETLISN